MRRKPPALLCRRLLTLTAHGSGLLWRHLSGSGTPVREKLESLLPLHLGQVAKYAGNYAVE